MLRISEDDKLYRGGFREGLSAANYLHDSRKYYWLSSTVECHSPTKFNQNPLLHSIARRNGLALINGGTVQAAKEIYQNKKIDWLSVHNSLENYCEFLGLTSRQSKRVINYWKKLAGWSIVSKDRPDSLLVTTLLSKGLFPSTVSTFNHEENHHLDWRGKNENSISEKIPMHRPDLVYKGEGSVCRECERFWLSKRSPFKDIEYAKMKFRAMNRRLQKFVLK